MTCYELL